MYPSLALNPMVWAFTHCSSKFLSRGRGRSRSRRSVGHRRENTACPQERRVLFCGCDGGPEVCVCVQSTSLPPKHILTRLPLTVSQSLSRSTRPCVQFSRRLLQFRITRSLVRVQGLAWEAECTAKHPRQLLPYCRSRIPYLIGVYFQYCCKHVPPSVSFGLFRM